MTQLFTFNSLPLFAFSSMGYDLVTELLPFDARFRLPQNSKEKLNNTISKSYIPSISPCFP